MPWIKIDDHIAHHPRIFAAGAVACSLWVCGLACCQRAQSTTVDEVALASEWPFSRAQYDTALARLLAVGLVCRRGESLDFPTEVGTLLYKLTPPVSGLPRHVVKRLRYHARRLLPRLIARDEKCVYCGTSEAQWVPDHVQPIARGGQSTLENLALACPTCNQAKGAKSVEVFRRG